MKLLLASGLFFVVRLIEVDMKKVVFVLLVAGVLQGGIGIAQFLTQESVDSSIFGMSAHNASQAGSSVLKIDSGRFLRAYGTFPHPNVLGGFLGVILVLCISYYVSAIKEKESYKLQVTSYKKNEIPPLEDSVGMTIEGLMLTGGSIIILLGLLLTFSRTAWLGALLGLVVIGLSAFKQKDYWIRRKFVKIFLALGMAGLVFGFILHEQIFPRFDTKAIEHEGSVSERIVSLQDAWTLINNHPIVGVGAGNFTTAIIEKGEMGIMGERGEMGSRPVWSIQPAHNVFILIWSELGLIGIVLFVLFLFFILKSSITNHNSAILIAIFPSLFLDHFLWSSHFGLLFFFLLLGLTSRKYCHKKILDGITHLL
ncbi:MAG: O-antigen ligase family protein [Candidatus Moraniibacteriota bacterium]